MNVEKHYLSSIARAIWMHGFHLITLLVREAYQYEDVED